MRRLTPVLVVTVLCVSQALAATAAGAPFSTKSFGDGGGYKHPDAAVGQFFETKPADSAEPKPGNPADLKPARPSIPANPAGESRPALPSSALAPASVPAPAAPSRPRPRPFASASAPKAAAPQAPIDTASEDARRDYESKILGSASESRRAELADPALKSAQLAVPDASRGEGMLFVSLELDSKEAGALRDAVAGLGETAAFRPDARFQPLPGEDGSVRISGWLPVSRLGDVIARPGVRRVSVESGSQPAIVGGATGDYLLTMRVPDAAHPEESIDASVRELTAATGFKLSRVFGFENVPGRGASAIVSGTLPVARLSHALGLPNVIKVSAALPSSTVAGESSVSTEAAKTPAVMGGFLRFMMARGLWLILITALLALPAVGEAVKKGLGVFVPYR